MKIKLVLSSRSNLFYAEAIYDTERSDFVVKKGARVNEKLSTSKSFKGISSITKKREGIIQDGILQQDTHFKSPSTAANFVTGASTNGLVRWKDKKGISLKKLLL